MPLKSYIQFRQMQTAFLALLNGKNITEAAMLAGFDSPSHFATVTKKMMGMPASISVKNSVFLKWGYRNPTGFRRWVKVAKSKVLCYTCVMGTWKSKNRHKYLL